MKKTSDVSSEERGGFPIPSIFPEVYRPGRSVLTNLKERERPLVAVNYVVLVVQCEVQAS
jgi:hypothetical protein